MKKTYVSPTIEVVPLKTRSQILQVSLKTNVNLRYVGPTDDDFFDEDNFR